MGKYFVEKKVKKILKYFSESNRFLNFKFNFETDFFSLISLEEKDFVFPIEDPFLITYLRPCKFYPQSTLERMQKYFKFKAKHKKICENLTPDSVRNVFEDGLFKYYPLRDKEGRRILCIHGGSETRNIFGKFKVKFFKILFRKMETFKSVNKRAFSCSSAFIASRNVRTNVSSNFFFMFLLSTQNIFFSSLALLDQRRLRDYGL